MPARSAGRWRRGPPRSEADRRGPRGERPVGGRHRMPRGEHDPVFLGGGQQIRAHPRGDVVERRHRGDRHDRLRNPQLLKGDVGQAHVADEPGLAQFGENADLVLERRVKRAPAVQVVQVDHRQAQPPRAHLGALPQVVRVADRIEGAVVEAAPDEAALGGDDQAVGIRVERILDQQLVVVRAVHVGGVNQVDAGVDDAPQDPDPVVVIRIRPPHLVAGQLHRPVADATDVQVSADRDLLGIGRGRHDVLFCPILVPRRCGVLPTCHHPLSGGLRPRSFPLDECTIRSIVTRGSAMSGLDTLRQVIGRHAHNTHGPSPVEGLMVTATNAPTAPRPASPSPRLDWSSRAASARCPATACSTTRPASSWSPSSIFQSSAR